MNRPQGGHITVTAENGVLEVRMPLDVISELAGSVTSDKSLRAKLPKFAPELASGFTAQLAEPQRSGTPQMIRIVRIALTRTEIVGSTVVELASPVEVHV